MVKLLVVWIALAVARAQDSPKPEASISGTIMNSDGVSMKDVQVIVPLGPSKSVTAVSDAAGRYSLKGIPPGQQRVVASAPDREHIDIDILLRREHL